MTNLLAVRATGGPGGPTRGTGPNVSQREDLANFITMITKKTNKILFYKQVFTISRYLFY